MGAIRILPDRVANQIAAGEVVERPVSIVKELIENSLDAGATRVEIEFNHGGRSLIRVEDNGSGMSRDDALLSLERHATSKIREAADLDHVLSFGFRGEALPAIASVSRFTLQTRDASSESGIEILVNGGKVLHVRDCGMPVGTRVVVANLFNSVPARRKFLKSDATEAAHVIHHARLHALANPEVSFSLVEDGRAILQSPVCASLGERVGEVFGRQVASDLLPVEAEEGELRLEGLISRPGVARATRHEMVTYVNRRPVDSRTLAYAVLESYHTLLPKGRYPMVFLFLKLPPSGVDVNVHPAKREVRFRDEVKVRGFAIRSVLGALRAYRGEAFENRGPAAPSRSEPGAGARGLPAEPVPAPPAPAARPTAMAPPAGPVVVPDRIRPPGAARPGATEAGTGARVPDSATGAVPAWRHLGDIEGGFSVFAVSGGLVILDRRAASERVWYERLLLRQQALGGAPECQRLLLPIPLEIDPLGAAALARVDPYLRRLGLEIEPFGRAFYRIEGIPPWLDPGQAETFARELIDLAKSDRLDGGGDPSRASEGITRAAAARAATPAAATLAPAALERLVADLLRCAHPHSSPAGRPTLIEIGGSELSRRFQRTSPPRRAGEE